MHSRLFQIENGTDYVKPLPDLDARDIHPDCDWYRESKDFEEDDLASLMRCLPKGCFQLDGRVLTLVKKPTEYLEKYLDEVKLAFNLLTPKDLGSVKYHKAIRKARNNDIMYRVYSENFNCSVPLIEWLMEEVMPSTLGQTFTIGSIIDYHV